MVTGDLEPRPERPVDPIHAPSWRLDEQLRQKQAELDYVRALLAEREAEQARRARRETHFGRVRIIKEGAAADPGGERRHAFADVVQALHAFSVGGLVVAGVAMLLVFLIFVFGIGVLAVRFAHWAGSGNAVLGAAVFIVACVGIVACGLWLTLRLTERRSDQ